MTNLALGQALFRMLFGVLSALTLACANQSTGHAQKERDALPSPEAQALHERGRVAGARGDHTEALTLFSKAAALAPRWPYPLYDRAFTHLLMKNSDAALADYRDTLKLAPRGFFTAHVAVDTLVREKRGEFPSGLYLAFVALETEPDPDRKRDVLEQMVEKFPRFAPGWQKFAELAETPTERLKRIEAGLAVDPDPETSGMLKLNQAAALHALGKTDAAIHLLRALVNDPGTTLSVESLAKTMLTRK